MAALLYVMFVGFPLSVFFMAAGVLFCVTITGLPVGLACFALGFKVLSPARRRVVVIR